MKEDFRLQKTYKALENAFREIIRVKTFEAMTVQELCEKAAIRTATFYNHFSDKYDFFYFLMKRLNESYISEKLQDAATSSPEGFVHSFLSLVLQTVEENSSLVKALEDAHILSPTLTILSKEAGERVVDCLKAFTKKGIKLTSSPELLVEIIQGSLSSISHWWLFHGQGKSVQELVSLLEKPFYRLIFA